MYAPCKRTSKAGGLLQDATKRGDGWNIRGLVDNTPEIELAPARSLIRGICLLQERILDRPPTRALGKVAILTPKELLGTRSKTGLPC